MFYTSTKYSPFYFPYFTAICQYLMGDVCAPDTHGSINESPIKGESGLDLSCNRPSYVQRVHQRSNQLQTKQAAVQCTRCRIKTMPVFPNFNISYSQCLHSYIWLPVKQRVEYKLCMMVHRCLYGDAPSYLAVVLGDQSTWPTCMEQTSTTASSRLFICYF